MNNDNEDGRNNGHRKYDRHSQIHDPVQTDHKRIDR